MQSKTSLPNPCITPFDKSKHNHYLIGVFFAQEDTNISNHQIDKDYGQFLQIVKHKLLFFWGDGAKKGCFGGVFGG